MNSPGDDTGGKAPYQCDRCGRTFNDPAGLREHEKDCKGPDQTRRPLKP
jgi:hypothetical protein